MDSLSSLTGNKIALLIDFDNVILGVDDPGFDVEIVVNALRSRGNVVMGRAYGDWYRHHRHRRKLMEQGIELVETPVFGPLIKNSADIRIVLDGFEIAMSQPHINTFCLVSGDSDFLPLIKKLQYLGKHVIVIAGIKFTSDLIRRNCNEYISYENLFAESVGATEDVSTIEGAYTLLERAINTLNERIMDVRSSSVKQMMVQLNPAFSERSFGCSQFKQFLERAERDSRVNLEMRDGSAGEMSVYWRDDAPRPEVKPQPPQAAHRSSVNGALRHSDRPADRPARDLSTARRSGRKFSGRAGSATDGTAAPATASPATGELATATPAETRATTDRATSDRTTTSRSKTDAATTEPDERMTVDDVVVTALPDGSAIDPSLDDDLAIATPPAGGFVNNLAKRTDLRPGRLRFSSRTGTQPVRRAGAAEVEQTVSEELAATEAAAAAPAATDSTAKPARTSRRGRGAAKPAGEAKTAAEAKPADEAKPVESAKPVDESLQQTSDAALAAEAFEAAAENAPKKKATRRGGRTRKKKDADETVAAEGVVAEGASPDAEAATSEAAAAVTGSTDAPAPEAAVTTVDASAEVPVATPDAAEPGTLFSGDEGAVAAATEADAASGDEAPKKATRARRGGTKRTTTRKKKDADAPPPATDDGA